MEVLRRKLEVVEKRYKKSQLDYERYAVVSISSIYGVDLLEDNVEECRHRLYDIFNAGYTRIYGPDCKDACRSSVRFILDRNILTGDALTLKAVGNGDEPIVFSEWSLVSGNMLKRRDYTLANLLAYQPMEGPNLFSDLGEEAFIPKPIAEYPLEHFLKLEKHV